MNGMEKITTRIAEDVQREIDALTEGAHREAGEIAARFRAQAEQETADLRRKGERAAAEREERLGSMAAMEAKKLELAAKQELIAQCFDLALEKLAQLPDEDYIALLAGLAVKAARTGREKVIFSQRDRNRVGKAVVTRANETLAKRVSPRLPEELTDTKAGAFLDKMVTGASAILTGAGMLTLAEETRPIRGGFILTDGEVETNCAFETLVRLQREQMAGEVAKVLFNS